MKDVTELS